jgi:MFS family permease
MMWAIFVISLMSLAGLAISPALNQMKTIAFPQHTLSEIQTALVMNGLMMPCASLLSAAVIRYGLMTKRIVVTFGFFLLGLTGILAQFLHSALWNLALLSGMTGFAMGCYFTTILSILMDRFSGAQRQKVLGYQTVFVYVGAVLLSVFGGLLAVWRWYGGYLILLAGIPMGIISLLALPKDKRIRTAGNKKPGQSASLKPVVYYYTAIIIVFMMLSSSVNYNLAVHMAASGINNAAIVGALASCQMIGGAVFGLIFGRFSARFKDYTLAIGYVCLAVGLIILSVCGASLVLAFVSVFLTGAAMSMLGPQCTSSMSEHVDAGSSALASSLINGFAPGLGGFLSPMIVTNVTTAIAGESTRFRYQFVAAFAIICAVIIAIFTHLRAKKDSARLTEALCRELAK